MSAVVKPRCGHASHLMEVDCMGNSPQVHLHFLTEPFEAQLCGFHKLELCCHGCGESILVYYYEPGTEEALGPEHLKARDEFVQAHEACQNRGYENHCPNYRSSTKILDLRGAVFAKVVEHLTIHPSIVSKPNRRPPRRPRHG